MYWCFEFVKPDRVSFRGRVARGLLGAALGMCLLGSLEGSLEAQGQGGTQDFPQDPELQKLLQEAGQEAEQGMAETKTAKGGPGWLNAFNPRITAFGDFVFHYADDQILDDNGDNVANRFSLREAELDMRADIDPYAKGVVILAFGEESPGEYVTEVEEAYATFETLPYNLRLKIGKFRPWIGLDNRLHTHDLPYTDRPLVTREFFGDEGWSDAGMNLDWLTSLGDASSLTLGYTIQNGEGTQILAGSVSTKPSQLARAEYFTEVGTASFFQAGASLLAGPSDADGGTTRLWGADFLYKWRPEQRRDLHSVVFQGEGYLLDRDTSGQKVQSVGAYSNLLWQFDQNWYLGVRGDWTEFADQDSGHVWGASAWLSYYSSEFLRIRVGIEHTDDPRGLPDTQAFLQLTFVLGSHPTEPYWVNR